MEEDTIMLFFHIIDLQYCNSLAEPILKSLYVTCERQGSKGARDLRLTYSTSQSPNIREKLYRYRNADSTNFLGKLKRLLIQRKETKKS